MTLDDLAIQHTYVRVELQIFFYVLLILAAQVHCCNNNIKP